MMQPILSIILPVYDGAKFIKQALDSLMHQLVKDVEVIVVDDGSQDATLVIINTSFLTYIEAGQLSVYTQKNQGVSAARNMGITKAKGHYIGFMDADDVVFDHYIQEIMHAIKQNIEIDIVEFGYKFFSHSLNETILKKTFYSNDQFGNHPIASVIDKVYGIARWYPWTRVYKASLFKGVRFPVGVSFCEDLMTIPQLYEKAKSVLLLKKPLYGYRVNNKSATFNVVKDDIDKLSKFYDTIPVTGLTRHTYLRISVAYAIYSCQIKASGNRQLPEKIRRELLNLPFSFSVYRHFSLRKIVILFYPLTYKIIKKIISF